MEPAPLGKRKKVRPVKKKVASRVTMASEVIGGEASIPIDSEARRAHADCAHELSVMAYLTAHQLNNLLAIGKGNLSLLRRSLRTELQVLMLNDILSMLDRAQGLSAELARFSRLEDFSLRRLSLAEFMLDYVNRARCQPRPLLESVVQNFPEEIKIDADPEYLKLAFDCLLAAQKTKGLRKSMQVCVCLGPEAGAKSVKIGFGSTSGKGQRAINQIAREADSGLAFARQVALACGGRLQLDGAEVCFHLPAVLDAVKLGRAGKGKASCLLGRL